LWVNSNETRHNQDKVLAGKEPSNMHPSGSIVVWLAAILGIVWVTGTSITYALLSGAVTLGH
jgi:hypothetical protein